MQNGENPAAAPGIPLSTSRERCIVGLLCLLGAAHVFVFSAAFPFFGTVDEQNHFDLTVKYAEGQLPRSLERVSTNAVPYVVIYGTHEYLWASNDFPVDQFPPPWSQPMEKIGPKLLAWEASWNQVTNHETLQPPLYYVLTGLGWRAGTALGLHDGFLLYSLRFLNMFVVAALVWLGFATARMIFPDNGFVQLGVPALLAFLPQSVFYSIQNDVLSPLCFGAAFLGLVKWLHADVPGVRLGALTGLALAATFLTKISNLPLLAVSGLAVLFKFWELARAGKLRAAAPATLTLVLCAGLPMLAWLLRCKLVFGDFTGTAAKIQFLGWTHKPFGDWWRHPIFSPHGLWTFLSGLFATFWQGEMLWHRQPLMLPAVNLIYAVGSIGLLGAAVAALLVRPPAGAARQQALWFGVGCVAAAVMFLGFLSVIYDFQDCFYPSRAHPYFTSGRLMLGALIPFALLFLFGLDRILSRVKARWLRPAVLAAIILFMLVSEIVTDWRIFPNAYNWFHL